MEICLRNSPMDYSLKVNLYYKKVAFTPCSDCPFQGERSAIPIWEKTEKCFQRCPYDIVIWILNPRQLTKYEELRPQDKKKKEIERAIREGKLVQVEETLRASGELVTSPSFYYAKYI